MKISKLFHWLYACVMFLPLLVLPIFAINIINRSNEPISIQHQVDDVKNFYQGVKNGKPNNLVGWASDIDIYIDVLDNVEMVYIWEESSTNIDADININNNDYIYLSFSFFDDHNVNLDLSLGNDNTSSYLEFYSGSTIITSGNIQKNSIIVQSNISFNTEFISFYYYDNYDLYLKDFQVFNLTTIFGSGNEPTKEVFESYLTKDYYDFGNNDVVIGQSYVTYNDTDIGSQVLYSLYHVVDKYFNFNSFMPFGGLYSWFVSVIFSGFAPLGFTIIYNLMIYWLFTSLIWLMFDVFMYVPLVIHNLIDKARIE